MKILYFSRDYTTHDRRFLSALAESTNEIVFLRLEADGIPYEARPVPVREIKWSGGHTRRKKLEDWLELLPEFLEVLEREKPDLIHAGPVQSCAFIAALSGYRPLAVMSWGSDILTDAKQNDLSRWITQFTLSRADGFICDCDAVREQAREFVQGRLPITLQFPWGVELERFAPTIDRSEAKKALGLADTDFVILSTRSWEELYDIPVLIEAVRLCHARRPQTRLLLLGTGSQKHQIADLLKLAGLCARTLTPGVVPQDSLPQIFRAADLYVSSARSDGTSISLLEAMASALPVVVTDAPGNREWVSPGETGLLARQGDARSFADAILEVSTWSPQKRNSVGLRSRAIAVERADWRANVKMLLRAFENMGRPPVSH